MLFNIFSGYYSGTEELPFVFLASFCVHIMLPNSRKVSVFQGVFIAVADLIIVGVFSKIPCESNQKIFKILQVILSIFFFYFYQRKEYEK